MSERTVAAMAPLLCHSRGCGMADSSDLQAASATSDQHRQGHPAAKRRACVATAAARMNSSGSSQREHRR
jgi:hypothetical protein